MPPGEISVASTKPFTCQGMGQPLSCGIIGMKLPDICNQLKVPSPSVCFQAHSLTQLLGNIQVFSRKAPPAPKEHLSHSTTSAAGLEWLRSKACSPFPQQEETSSAFNAPTRIHSHAEEKKCYLLSKKVNREDKLKAAPKMTAENRNTCVQPWLPHHLHA